MVQALRERDVPAVADNATEPAVLIPAHIARASVLVIATPDTFHVRAMIEIAQTLNPSIGPSSAAITMKKRRCSGERVHVRYSSANRNWPSA